MKSFFYHIQFNILFENLSFYNDLLSLMGWTVIFKTDEVAGFKSSTNGDLWFVKSETENIADYDLRGTNHIALRVENQKDIDELAKYLKEREVDTLFDTPRHRSEFVDNKEETYYQIMFTSPDQILFEVVFIGKKG